MPNVITSNVIKLTLFYDKMKSQTKNMPHIKALFLGVGGEGKGIRLLFVKEAKAAQIV